MRRYRAVAVAFLRQGRVHPSSGVGDERPSGDPQLHRELIVVRVGAGVLAMQASAAYGQIETLRARDVEAEIRIRHRSESGAQVAPRPRKLVALPALLRKSANAPQNFLVCLLRAGGSERGASRRGRGTPARERTDDFSVDLSASSEPAGIVAAQQRVDRRDEMAMI